MKRVTGTVSGHQVGRIAEAARRYYTGGNLREAVDQARKDLYHPHRSKSISTKYGSPARTVALRCNATRVVVPVADLVRSTSTHLDKYGNVLSKQGTFVMAVF